MRYVAMMIGLACVQSVFALAMFDGLMQPVVFTVLYLGLWPFVWVLDEVVSKYLRT